MELRECKHPRAVVMCEQYRLETLPWRFNAALPTHHSSSSTHDDEQRDPYAQGLPGVRRRAPTPVPDSVASSIQKPYKTKKRYPKAASHADRQQRAPKILRNRQAGAAGGRAGPDARDPIDCAGLAAVLQPVPLRPARVVCLQWIRRGGRRCGGVPTLPRRGRAR